MSGRQHKKNRAREQRIYVERFMASYIAKLRQILKRAWPDYVRHHPETRGPCHTCAFKPSADSWPGFEKTVFSLMDAIQQDHPFYCHEHLPTNANCEWQWDPVLATRCRGWEAIAERPDTARGRVRRG